MHICICSCISLKKHGNLRDSVFLLELTFFRVATASKYPDGCYCRSASGVLFSKYCQVKSLITVFCKSYRFGWYNDVC